MSRRPTARVPRPTRAGRPRRPRPAAEAGGDVYEAIAHPLRRELLEALARGERSVQELATPLPVSRPAVSQHLRVLHDAGLVRERRDGRRRCYRLEPRRLEEISSWVAGLDRFWEGRLAGLRGHLERVP